MGSCVASHQEKVWIKDICSVSSIWYSIVNDQCNDDSLTGRWSIRDIFSSSASVLAAFRKSLAHGLTTWASVTYTTSSSLGNSHIFGNKAEVLIPFLRFNRFLVLQKVNGYFDSRCSFSRYHRNLTRYRIPVPIKVLKHIFQYRNHLLRISPGNISPLQHI